MGAPPGGGMSDGHCDRGAALSTVGAVGTLDPVSGFDVPVPGVRSQSVVRRSWTTPSPFNHRDPAAGGLTVPWELACYCREHHRLKTFHDGPGGWQDQQLRRRHHRVDLTDRAGVSHHPRRVRAVSADATTAMSGAPTTTGATDHARRHSAVHMPARGCASSARSTPKYRRVNYARKREIELRKWRNNMRRTLILFKGHQPSTSPWCTWVNDPLEPEQLPPDWTPPPPSPQQLDDDPPF